MHRRSLLRKMGHPLFAILAVWCLGCSSFDALLDRAFSSTAAAQPSCMPLDMSSEKSTTSAVTLTGAEAGDGIDGCGCSHCVGVSSGSESPVIAATPIPDTPVGKAGRALRADLDPLVPPPQGIFRI